MKDNFKFIVALAFIAVFGQLIFTIISGIQMRKYGKAERYLEEHHRSAATQLLILMGISVTLTEIMVRVWGYRYSPLFAVHLVAAVSFTLMLVSLRFFLTGLTHPRAHRMLAYTALASYLVAFVTGMVLLNRL